MPALSRAAVAALALWAAASSVAARPFIVDDLLHQESLGAVAVDPAGRWLVFEQRDRYDTARRYDNYLKTSETLGRLRVVDLAHPTASRRLLAEDPGPGLVMGAFSPSGARLAVYRIRARRWTLGVVTMGTGAVRWFDLTPQEPLRGRSLQWLSDTELLVIARPDRLPPSEFRTGWIASARLPALWNAAAAGRSARTILGSGTYAPLRDRWPARRLVLVDTVSGAHRDLARGAFIDAELSPDRRRVALLESGPDIQVHGDAPVRGPAGSETEATRLSILDLATGARRRPCPGCDALPQLLAWSPSGRALLIFARGEDGLWTTGHLLQVDAATGAATVVGAGLRPQADLNPVVVRAGWLGEDPVIYARPEDAADARADWFRLTPGDAINLTRTLAAPDKLVRAADATHLALFAGERLWRIDRDGRAEELDARPAGPALHDSRASEGARLANSFPAASWVVLGQGAGRSIARLDAGGLHPIGRVEATDAQPVAASWAFRAAVLRGVDRHGVERLTLLRGAGPMTLATINPSFAGTDAPDVAAVHHRGARGEPLVSWLFTPPERADGRRPPLIVRPYLGDNHPAPPTDRYMEAGFLQNLRLLTGHGYAVLVPSLPNPPQGMTEPADHVADRILAIVQAAIDDPDLGKRFDADHMALLGWSFGGYTTMAAITQTDRFCAAVEMDGISDLIAYWAHLSIDRLVAPEDGYGGNWSAGGVEATQPALGMPPWRDPERYRRNSPLMAADKVHTPLLLIHGGQDPIPIAGSEAMFSALFRQSKDAILVTYWGANHSPTSPGDIRDVYARTFSFLDEHLDVSSCGAAHAANPAPDPASGAPRPPGRRR